MVCAAVSALLAEALLWARCDAAELERWAARRIRRACWPMLLVREGLEVKALDSSIARKLAGLRRETEVVWLTCV